jgi:CubicO group peptidase (beta-lactamase class C family)
MSIHRFAVAIVAASLLLGGTTAHADELPRATPDSVGISSERLGRIATVLNADIEAGKLPGAVVAIVRKDKLVYFEAFGWRDKAADVRMTTDTIFSIASMTKPMVAVGALMLSEQGQLNVGEPLARYLPQFAKMTVAQRDAAGQPTLATVPAEHQITLQDLFRHTSGLIYGGRGSTVVHKLYPAGSFAAAENLTGDQFLDKLASLPLLWQPGTTWDYGFGLDVLGLVIEKQAHEPLNAYMAEHLFRPLGMVDTGFIVPADKAARYAHALPTDPETGKPQHMSDATKPTKFDCGGGCAVSTASDYLHFALMLMHGGALGETRILGRKTVEYMLADQLGPDIKNLIGNADPTRADYGFGLGLAVRQTEGRVRLMGSVGDFTWPGASGTNWWVDPKEELAVVFMAHSPGTVRWHYRETINALVYQALL